MPLDFWTGLVVLGSSVFSALFAISALYFLADRPTDARSGLLTGDDGRVVFLFDGEHLIDATPNARALLAASPIRGGSWTRTLAYLKPRFSGFEAALARLPEDGTFRQIGADPSKPLSVLAEHIGGLTRITLSSQRGIVDSLAHAAMTEELKLLREIAAAEPSLVWQQNTQGDVVWANASYLTWIAKVHSDLGALGWPMPRLFASPPTQNGQGNALRQCLTISDAEKFWFEITEYSIGDNRLFFASSADATQHAEASLNSFMQILTKTFAQLPIGLAIFDAQRKLQLFNPALADLTGLPVDFLTTRPSLLSVLDALRERKMLPEPKDYRSWRRQVVEMEKAASSGRYEETWALSDGQTYRVIGRPHPNGALSLMIEDISSEVLRTRRYRADLELGQSVIDQMETALAVFSPSGHLVMSNLAYAALWAHDPAENLERSTLRNLAAHWRATTSPSGLWSEFEDYVATIGDRVSWDANARLLDGRSLACTFSPLAGGATLAVFRPHPATESVPPLREETDSLQSA
jgi:PAS domain-containing protein